MYTRTMIAIGMAGGLVSRFFGGWDAALQALVFFIILDYAMGLVVAGVCKKSPKCESGALNSRIGFIGIVKKCVILVLVAMAHQFDAVLGWDFVRHAVIVAFIANESISIIENAGLIGVPIPEPLKQAIDILKSKGGSENEP